MPASRTYELKRRAELQEETRRRIVAAAVELHTTLGPSRTTVQAIAEKAGVTRPTVYAHFPDARSLFERADQALYQAKDEGKGRVVLAPASAAKPV